MRYYLVSITLVLFFLGNNAHGQMACKDTLFNIDKTQHMCLYNIWGDWVQDSIVDQHNKVMQLPCSTVWSFNSTGEFKDQWECRKDRINRCVYKFMKGYLELNNCDDGTIKVSSPYTYKVLFISPQQLVIQTHTTVGAASQDVYYFHKKEH